MEKPETSGSDATRLRISSRFALRGLWVRPEALGHAFTWAIDGRQVTLTMPHGQEDFAARDEPETPQVPAWAPTARVGGSGDAVSVQLIKVEVTAPGPVSAARKAEAFEARDRGDDRPLDDFGRVVEGLWREGHERAERAAHAWLGHVRATSGQVWLGTAAEPPAQYGRSHIFDVDANVRLMSFGPEQSATIRSGHLALSLDELHGIAHAVAIQSEPPVAETLLADARFLAEEAEVVDSQRAVLAAAAACEIKTKLTMRLKASSSQKKLLDLVLRRVSNLPELLDGTISAALNVSLRQAEPQLYSQAKRLKELRDKIIHVGIQVDRHEGRRLVAAAQQIFQWLDGL